MTIAQIDDAIRELFARNGITPGQGPDGFGLAAEQVWRRSQRDYHKLANLSRRWFVEKDSELQRRTLDEWDRLEGRPS